MAEGNQYGYADVRGIFGAVSHSIERVHESVMDAKTVRQLLKPVLIIFSEHGLRNLLPREDWKRVDLVHREKANTAIHKTRMNLSK